MLPSNVTVETHDFQNTNFTIYLLWEAQEADDTYSVTVNAMQTSTTYNTTLPTLTLEGFYNVPTMISLVGINCVGRSESVAKVVHEGNTE